MRMIMWCSLKETTFCASSFRLFSVILVACLPLASCSQEAKSPDTPAAVTDFAIEYEKYTLDNGLDIILHVDRSDPVVAVTSVFNVGSSREVQGRTGFAHFFEHMSFNDSENVPRGANRKYIEELGGTRNGGTSFDYTIYYEAVPSDALEKIFWIDSDRMGYMINTVTDAALEREKQVVKNEKRQRVDNAPYGHTGAVILDNLYPEGHPYSWSVIGSLEDLQNATLEDVKKFYERWYGANNATLVVAGDFDPETIKPQIEQWFGEIRRGPEVQPMMPMPVELEATRNLWYPDNFAKLPELKRVYAGVEDYHPDSYALRVLGQVLAGSKRAPLYQVVVEEQKLAPRVSARGAFNQLAGTFTITVRAMEGTKLNDVEAAINKGLTRFAKEGFTAAELGRIKAELETAFYQRNSGVLNKARTLAMSNEFAGDPGYAGEYVRRIQAVSIEDVMRVFVKYLQGRHFVQTSFVPKNTPELAVSDADLAEVTEEKIVQGAEVQVSQGELADYRKTPSKHDRSEPPLGALPVIRSPEIWTRSLSNDIEVTGVKDDEVPLVAFHLMLPGGQWLDSTDRVGASSLLAALSTQGTASRTPAELEEAIGSLGATIRFSADAEAFGVTAYTLQRNFEATVALVEEMLLEPRWDAAEFERLRNAAEASIVAAEGNAGAVARQAWYRVLYGEEHPYGRPSRGTRESIAAMTIDDLKDWHSAYIAPAGASIQVAGAIDSDRVVEALGRLTERWTGKPAESPEYELRPPPPGQSVYFIDLPGAKQSVIQLGKRAVSVMDPDWVALFFANQRLGAGASARLTQLLRIEKGYTYGARSGLGRFINDVAPWAASTSVRANVTLESMQLIREQITAYAATFTDGDTEVTRNQVIKRNARAFETLTAKMNLLKRIAQLGQPHDIVERQMAVLQGMSTADFQEVITDYLDESQMIWVVVGDGATQRERLQEFGYGKPVELDRQGGMTDAPRSDNPGPTLQTVSELIEFER